MLSVTVDLLHVDRRTSPLILFPHKCAFTEIDHVSLHKATEIFFRACVYSINTICRFLAVGMAVNTNLTYSLYMDQ